MILLGWGHRLITTIERVERPFRLIPAYLQVSYHKHLNYDSIFRKSHLTNLGGSISKLFQELTASAWSRRLGMVSVFQSTLQRCLSFRLNESWFSLFKGRDVWCIKFLKSLYCVYGPSSPLRHRRYMPCLKSKCGALDVSANQWRIMLSAKLTVNDIKSKEIRSSHSCTWCNFFATV